MTNYDNDLIQLQQKVALKKQLEAKLNDLREQRKVFDKQVIELRVAHRSEQEDVEKLKGKSLANYFYQVVGKLDDKLTEERRQATAARVNWMLRNVNWLLWTVRSRRSSPSSVNCTVVRMLLFSVFGYLYMRGLSTPTLSEAILTGVLWSGICIVFDVFGWVIIKHPWSLSFKGFYIDYQPWITLIYIAIFLGPLVGYCLC